MIFFGSVLFAFWKLTHLTSIFSFVKVATNKGGGNTANAVEERWHAPAQDEDYWLPIRPNSNTRIDTLPGAQNLGEIDDAVYFRNKLFTALYVLAFTPARYLTVVLTPVNKP